MINLCYCMRWVYWDLEASYWESGLRIIINNWCVFPTLARLSGHARASETQKTRYDSKRYESPRQKNTAPNNIIEVRGVSTRHLPNTFNQEMTLGGSGYLKSGSTPDVVGIRYFVKQNKICAWTSRPKVHSSGNSMRGILKSSSGSLFPSSSVHDSVKSSLSASLQSLKFMQMVGNGKESCGPDTTLKDEKDFRLHSPGTVSSTPTPASNVSGSIQHRKMRASGLVEELDSFKRYRCLHTTPSHNGSGDKKLEKEKPEKKIKTISSPESALPILEYKLTKNKQGDVPFHQIINGLHDKERVQKSKQRGPSSKQMNQSSVDARRRFERMHGTSKEKPVESGTLNTTSSSSETVMDRNQLISMQVKDTNLKPPCEGPSAYATPRVMTTHGDNMLTGVTAVQPGFKTLRWVGPASKVTRRKKNVDYKHIKTSWIQGPLLILCRTQDILDTASSVKYNTKNIDTGSKFKNIQVYSLQT